MNIPFNIPDFRTLFPAFGKSCVYASDSILDMYFATATLYISDIWPNCSNGMSLAQQTQALYLMTAHLLQLQMNANKNIAGNVESASIDKVSVTVKLPEFKNQWQWWLNQTTYGQNLWALLQTVAVGGFYVGGRPELAAFRRAPYRGA